MSEEFIRALLILGWLTALGAGIFVYWIRRRDADNESH